MDIYDTFARGGQRVDRRVLILFICLCLIGTTMADEGYKMPPKAIADLIDAPSTPRTSISPTKEYIMFLEWPGYPSIEEVSQPELRLGGLRINPRTNGPSRQWYYTSLTLRKMNDETERPVVGLPDNPKISGIDWTPNGKYIAFTNGAPDGLELWIVDVEMAAAKRLGDFHLNGVMGSAYEWLPDNKTLIVKTVVADRGEAPADLIVPTGPVIQENTGQKAAARTYQDLLKNEHDEQVFEYYAAAQILKVSIDGKTTPLGQPGIINSLSPSPDGSCLLVETTHKPFSYTVPYYRFPNLVEIWNTDGDIIHTVVDQPLAENIPIAFGSVQTGIRSVYWRQDADATLYWAEAQDGGDAAAEADIRDKVYMLPAPFDSDPVELIALSLRYDDVIWGDKNMAIVSESWWPTREVRAWVVKPGQPEESPRLVMDRSWQDHYSDPGRPLTHQNDRGASVLLFADNGASLFLVGDGASEEGERPFIDKLDIASWQTTRLFRSEAPYYERPITVFDPEKLTVLTRRESVTEPPNYFLRDLKKDDITQLTNFPDPTPQLRNVQKELIKYERADGVQLTGTLYLPEGYTTDDGPLPVLMWAYPTEYKSAKDAGQVTESPYRFLRVGWYSPMCWVTQGYAILDDPSMPIIGEGDEEPNDTFIEQLVSSAQAAIDELARRGVGDPNRVAIGGHSYGAFMTANLLAHSDLFRAGIARSGAYNRTLTPFGFQSEERTLWEAPDVYWTMSPFMHAEKINEPILLIHGQADNNSGTYPLQSERFYSALKGHGAIAKLVMLPHESHSYRARESIMHVLYEMTNWLDTYVKNIESN